MWEQTLIFRFATRFCFVELTFGWMPKFTRRSRASALHGCRRMAPWLFLPQISLPRLTSTSLPRIAQKVWRHCVLVFGHDRCSHAGNCIGLLANTGLYLSTAIHPFRFLTPAPVSILLCLASKASKFRDRSFWFMRLFSEGLHSWQLGIDVLWWIWMSHNSNTVLSCADSRIFNLYRLSKISSEGIFDIDGWTSSHLVSNSWIWSSWRVTENKSAWSNAASWAPLESSRRSWTGPLSGLSAPRGWPSSWTGNSGWSCSEQKQSSRPASRSLENPLHNLIARI